MVWFKLFANRVPQQWPSPTIGCGQTHIEPVELVAPAELLEELRLGWRAVSEQGPLQQTAGRA